MKVHELVNGLKAVFPVTGETHGATVEEAEMVDEEIPQLCVQGHQDIIPFELSLSSIPQTYCCAI